MKKIISVLVVAVLLATSLLAMVPASAATVKSYNINWTDHSYIVYGTGSNSIFDEGSFLNDFTLTKNETTLGANRKGGTMGSCSYVAATQFDITADTQYIYEVKVKTNSNNKYAGVPFAVDSSDNVYFAYGSYNNSNDTGDSWNPNKSYIITARGVFDYKYPSPNDELKDTAYFQTLQLDGGYATLRFVYNGLTVKVQAKNSSGNFVQMGYDVSLPTGSKLCFGIYNRDGDANANRTVTVKDGVIKAENQAAADKLVVDTNGAGALQTLILQVEQDYVQADYTTASWAALATALANAKTVVQNAASTKAEVTAAKDALELAAVELEFKTLDTTALKKAINDAKALKEVEYTAISYNMVMDAVKDAERLINNAAVKQSEIDAATATITGRIASLIPSGVIAEPEDDPDADVDADPDADADADVDPVPTETDPTIVPQPPVDTGAASGTSAVTPIGSGKGCKGAVATTVAVIGLVSVLGTALAIKKKD